MAEFKRVADIKRLNFILNALKRSVGEHGQVLDVGCGNGIITREVGAHGFSVYGIDVSDKAIETARSLNTLPNVKFDVISAEQLVADGNRYDAVICSEVLEHLNEPSKLLATLFQSLKDNGILIVTVPNGKGPREVLVTKPVQRMQRRNNWMWKSMQKFKRMLGYKGTTVQSSADDLTHIQFFTRNTLRQLAGNNHFTIVEFGKTNFMEEVFPFSFLARRSRFVQKMDCAVAELLPYGCTSGFVTVWRKA